MSTKTKTKKKNKPVKETKFKDEFLKIVLTAATSAEEKKGENILILDVSKLTVISDYFLIVTAKSAAQIQAIANNIEENLKKTGYNLISKEGLPESSWIIQDFGNLIVHIMQEKERSYYKLEKFWSNATIVNNELWQKAS